MVQGLTGRRMRNSRGTSWNTRTDPRARRGRQTRAHSAGEGVARDRGRGPTDHAGPLGRVAAKGHRGQLEGAAECRLRAGGAADRRRVGSV